MKKMDIQQELGGAEIFPLLVRLTIPATIAQIVNAVYSIVDRIYIGHLPNVGTVALSGVGLTFPITMMISAFSYLPGGGAPLAAIAIGEGNTKTAQKYLCNATSLLLTFSVVCTMVCLLFLKPLLAMFGADSETLPYAYEYLKIYVLGTAFVELALGLNPFINTQGFTTIGTASIVIGAALNILLDPLLMYTLNMGIRGAAIATVFSQFVSCLWIFWFLSSKRTYIRINLKDMKPDLSVMKKICLLGLSPFTFRVNESLVVVLLNRLIISHGGAMANLHIASLTIVNSISQIFLMPLIGIVNGAQPILSYNFGTKNYPRIRETIKYARILSFNCAVFTWAMIMVIPGRISSLFTDSQELISLTKITLRIMFCTVFALGFQMTNQNAFVAMGHTRYSFLFGIMRKVLLLVPLAVILPKFIGVWGVYAAEMISNPVTTVITFIVFERYMSKLKKEFH